MVTAGHRNISVDKVVAGGMLNGHAVWCCWVIRWYADRWSTVGSLAALSK